jgi:plasmid maintenance system killer protein
LAWLHAAPKQYAKQENPKSRFDTLTEDHPAKCLPEINGYLSICFQLSGVCLTGSAGIIPLTWVELKAFSQQSGYELTGWESEQIIEMSRDYCHTSFQAKDFNFPAPYQEWFDSDDKIKEMRVRVNKQWNSFK